MCSEHPRLQRILKMGYDRAAPHPHQSAVVECHIRNPPGFRSPKTAGGDQSVEVGIKIQVAAVGVWDDENDWDSIVFQPHPLFDHSGGQGREIMQQMSIAAEHCPKDFWHCEN